MSRLLLIRHGQASFGARDYDALSDLGREQAQVLGQALAARGALPDLVLHGAMRRHDGTVTGLLEGLGSRTFMMADLARTLRPVQAFQEVFEAATSRWASGADDDEYTESFPAFRDRVGGALHRAGALAAERRTLLVVSSGGPIAMAAALLLAGREPDADEAADAVDPGPVGRLWPQLNRVSVNTGVTKVIRGRRGLSLSTYNEHSHLEAGPRLLTHR